MKSTTLKIVSLLLLITVLLGVTSCSMFGEEEETTTEPTSASVTPLMKKEDKDAVLPYFNKLMAALNSKEAKAKLVYSGNYDPKGFECENEALKAALPTIVKLMSDGFNKDLGGEIAYGDAFASYLPVKGSEAPLVLTADDILGVLVNPEAYSRYEEESLKIEEAEKNSEKYETTAVVNVDEDVRKITITLKDEIDPKAGEGLFGKIYNIPDRQLIADEMAKAADYMTYDGTYEAKYTGCTIYMEIDRTTDNVIKVEFNRNIEVTATVTGVGTLESIGSTELKFVVNGCDRYEFDWNDPNAPAEAE